MKALFLILAFAVAGFAQELPTQYISWGSDAKCGKRHKISETDTVICDEKFIDGANVRYLYHNGVMMAVSFQDAGSFILVETFVLNNSVERVLIIPEIWSVHYYKSEVGQNIEKNHVESRSALDPDKLAKKRAGRFAWANALGAMGASMQQNTSQVYTTGTVRDNRGNSGTYSGTSTVTTPNTAAVNAQNQQARNRNAQAAAEADKISDGALRKNTVDSQGRVSGYVYFPKNKKANIGYFFLGTEKTSYVFAVNVSKK